MLHKITRNILGEEVTVYWNHRVISRLINGGTEDETSTLYIVEVYYDSEDHSIIGWTEQESIFGETVDELRQSLHWMLDALDKPVLDEGILLARAEEARATGRDDLFEERLTMDEVLDSLGLEREDIEQSLPRPRKTTFDTDKQGPENLGV